MAVHLSTVPDRAALQGSVVKSFPSEADEMQWQNNCIKHKDVHFIAFFSSFFFNFNGHLYFTFVLQMLSP